MIKVTVTMPDLSKKLNANLERIKLFMAAQIQTNRGMLFDQEGAYNGHSKWAPLRCREGQILSRTGTLRKSIAPLDSSGKPGAHGFVEIAGGKYKPKVSIGTTLAYAAMMNYGTTGLPDGKLRPKNAKALVFECGGEKRFAKWVKIPARPFDEWNQADQSEVATALSNLITEILNEAYVR